MTKLNQIIAVCGGQKGRTQKAVTEVYHKIQKDALLLGISRRYRPKEEDGETFPPESKRVNYTVAMGLKDTEAALTQLFDVVATQDQANCHAKADVVVDGITVLKDVPATTLIFLEKQATDLHTLVEKLPVLDAADEWTYSPELGCYSTRPTETVKTKKVAKVLVKYEATKEHPAQTELVHEDITTGYWETVKFSGAMAADEKASLLSRIRRLQDALKMAREEANSMEITQVNIGEAVFDYLLRAQP